MSTADAPRTAPAPHPARSPRVVIAGDSTAAPYIATAYPMCGWGAHLAGPLTALRARRTGGVDTWPQVVVDLAKNGASTQSHREQGLWDAVLDAAEAGDTVVMQFAHNDEKHEELSAFGGFTANLRTMTAEVQALGAHPVLCTPVARRRFEDGVLVPTHGDYPAAVQALAADLWLPLLDLHQRTSALLASRGEEGSKSLFTKLPPGQSVLYPDGVDDDTHFSIEGAIAVAEIVAELLDPILATAQSAS